MKRFCKAVIVILCTLIATGTNAEEVSPSKLQAGFAEVDITPKVGFRHAGGYTQVISTGVHDPLFAKAVVLKQGDTTIAIVINDLLSAPKSMSDEARKLASKTTDIPFDHIIIAATHNHGSPEYWGSLRDIFHEQAVAEHGSDPHETEDYQTRLIKSWVQAIQKAQKNMEPVSAEILVTEQKGVAFNRRFHMRDGTVRFNPGVLNPDIVRAAGPVDTELPFLLLSKESQPDTAIGGLSCFAMHTAVFGGREFGADFPGVMADEFRKEYGEDFVSLFAEGTAGDINHIDVTREREASSVETSQRIGKTLAKTIVDNKPLAAPIESPSLAVVSKIVHAALEPVADERYEQARSLLGSASDRKIAFMDLVRSWRDVHRHEHAKSYGDKKPLEVQAIRISEDLAIVSLPHEVFVETGMTIKAASPFRNTIVMSLANDIDYYIPTRRAFEEGSYEVNTCPLNPGCAELLSETAIELLNQLK